MNCIICGKEITQSYANSRCLGNYCRSCANNGGITTEQINEFKDKQLAELKAENERLKKYETIYYLNQLQASNEDIDKFRQNKIQQSINISDLLKDNTKQVCEKIREKLSLHCDYKDNIGWYMPENKFNLILDQIENDHNEQDKNN